MSRYQLSEKAKEDLIRIHHYGMEQFGEQQADKYFDAFFDQFEWMMKFQQQLKIYPSFRLKRSTMPESPNGNRDSGI